MWLYREIYGEDDPRALKARTALQELIASGGNDANAIKFTSVFEITEAALRMKEKDFEGAIEMYEKALALGQNYLNPIALSNRAMVMSSLSRAYIRLDDFSGAKEWAKKGLEVVARQRALFGSDEYKRKAGAEFAHNLTNILIACAIAEDDMEGAFDYLEQSKGRSLLDLLSSNLKRPAAARTEEAPGEALPQMARAGSPAEALVQPGAAPATGLKRTLVLEELAYKRLAENQDVNGRHIESIGNAMSLPVAVLKTLADEVTFVSYNAGGSGTFAAILGPEGCTALKLNARRPLYTKKRIKAFREGLGLGGGTARDLALETGDQAKPSSASISFEAAEADLYETLIAPVIPYIKTKIVYIIPDDCMTALPFEALRHEGRYLIEDYAIAYAPSVSVLKWCMDLERRDRKSLLALGNPNLKNPAFRLYHAEQEVRTLEPLFPTADVFTFDAATETMFKQRAGAADVLHLACHGELNLDDPMLTSLRLTPDSENDGYLHAGEIFDLDLRASLVVLSVCESAVGEESSGNELMGLTRSFLYAGAPAVIASLWKVDDRSTARLMESFYTNLQTMNKAEALRQAKLETMKEFPGPFHWAAFCLQGDYR